jgi:hypothetical protein
MFLCLVSRQLVKQAIEGIPERRRLVERKTIESTLKWYGEVVNINPCLFNFSVHAYEKLSQLPISLEGAEYLDFKRSYEFETQNGHSHFVAGDISCLAGDIEAVLAKAFAGVA